MLLSFGKVIILLLSFLYMKGRILSAVNDEAFIWYRFKPEILSLKVIDEIRTTFSEYDDYEVKYDLKTPYKMKAKRDYTFNVGWGNHYAIMICKDDSVNYILIKSHPLFRKVNKLIGEKFEFVKPVKIKEKKR